MIPKKSHKSFKIFISYSSEDECFVRELICLLDFIGLDIEKDIITSHVNEPDKSVQFESLKSLVNRYPGYELFVLIINSSDYNSSNRCQNELGFVWALGTKFFSFLVNGVGYDALDMGVCRKENSVKVDSKEAIKQLTVLKEQLGTIFGTGDIDDNVWHRKCVDFLVKVNSLPEYQHEGILGEDGTIEENTIVELEYVSVFDEMFRLLDINHYSSWAYKLACSVSPEISEKQYGDLHELANFLKHECSCSAVSSMGRLIENISEFVNDYVEVIDLHIMRLGKKSYTIDKFYISIPHNPCFDTDFYEYTEYCFLIYDMTLEFTRLLNLLIEKMQLECPYYCIALKELSIDKKEQVEVQYRSFEKTERPYPGLNSFLSVRRTRSKCLGRETNLDLFNL